MRAKERNGREPPRARNENARARNRAKCPTSFHQPARRPRPPPAPAGPRRSSERLAAAPPRSLSFDVIAALRGASARLPRELVRLAGGTGGTAQWSEAVAARRCDSATRGVIYDAVAGVTCHFCRQKKLCGEPGCRRCDARDADQPCDGKSECSRCRSACGRFCRACLDVRYGLCLDDIRKLTAPGGPGWLCPHCVEDVYGADDGWICNSSICLKRRGLPPTGVAVFAARAGGHASVAHALQATLRKGPGATLVGPRNGGVPPPGCCLPERSEDAAPAAAAPPPPALKRRAAAPRRKRTPSPPPREPTPPPPSGPRADLWRRRVPPKRLRG